MNQVILTRIAILGLITSSSLLLFLKDKLILSVLVPIILVISFSLDKKGKLSTRVFPLLAVSIPIILFQLIFNTSLPAGERFIQGFTAAAKIFTLSMLVFVFTSIVSVNQITMALSFLPPKIKLALVITFSMIPAIFAEAQKILLAQNARGYNTRGLNIVKSFIPFIIPLLHRTLRRAEQISITIQARGYNE